jgi:hypothetical protein
MEGMLNIICLAVLIILGNVLDLWMWASASHGMYESFLWTSNAEKYLE